MDFALRRPLPDGIGYVSQWFGANPDNYAACGLAGHEGIDYACPVGTEVLAAHAGTVYQAHDEGAYGLHVVLCNDYTGVTTVYAHLSKAVVSAGDRVTCGQPVGLSGSSGRSTGPHLHLGYRVAGVRNPAYGDWIDPQLGRKLGEA